jgi:hypothetical protein
VCDASHGTRRRVNAVTPPTDPHRIPTDLILELRGLVQQDGSSIISATSRWCPVGRALSRHGLCQWAEHADSSRAEWTPTQLGWRVLEQWDREHNPIDAA